MPPAMLSQRLPWSSIAVSRAGLGLGRIGSVQSPISPSEAIRLIQTAFDLGINFFDTANVYGQGDSERILGSALKSKRSQIIIATKAGLVLSNKARLASYFKPILRPLLQRVRKARSAEANTQTQSVPPAANTQNATSGPPGAQNFSADHIVHSIEASLRRLRTDYIDLFMLHSPPASGLDLDGLGEALQSARRAGKIRAVGVSSRSVEDLAVWLNWAGVDAIQVGLNVDGSALPHLPNGASANPISIIARQVLSRRGSRLDAGKDPSDTLRSALRVANVVLFGTTNISHLRENAAALASV